MNIQAGRSCPMHYRYSPDVFVEPASLGAEALYVVGGGYGNSESLRRVFEMKREEEGRTGGRVDLLFNGDFNGFDCDPESFVAIDDAVLDDHALRGNVDSALDATENGCGCNYLEYVDAAVVDRSDAIMRRLSAWAAAFPAIRARIAALPVLPMVCGALSSTTARPACRTSGARR